MDHPITALMVEDEEDWRTAIEASLALFGIKVDGVGTVAAFHERIRSRRYDLVIVDLGLPDDHGLSIVRHLTDTPGGPGVIILTGSAATEDRIKGFATGADLYFAKPVDVRELAVAAIRLAQRLRQLQAEPSPPVPSSKSAARWVLRPAQWALEGPAGASVRLTIKETAFMEALSRAADTSALRAHILQQLGYVDDDAGNRSLDALVRRLRIKVDEALNARLPVETVHGIGYVFSAVLKTA